MSNSVVKIIGIAAATLIAATGLALPPANAATAQPSTTQSSGITRTDLQRHDLSAPGREAVQVRVDIAPGKAFGRHTHPGEEIIYVLAGALEYQLDGQPPVTLKAGDVLFIPAGAVHAARNVGDVTGSELATYIVEKGKPLVALEK